MSGDHSPHEILKGAALAKKEYRALEIIVVTYYATLMKHRADKLLERLG